MIMVTSDNSDGHNILSTKSRELGIPAGMVIVSGYTRATACRKLGLPIEAYCMETGEVLSFP